MPDPSPVFDRHYEDYLKQLAAMDLSAVGSELGGEVTDTPEGVRVTFRYLGRTYHVSSQAILRPDGSRAGYDACIVLCRYLIMGRDRGKTASGRNTKDNTEWVGFRDLKESGPLTVYFKDNVESALTCVLTGKTDAAKAICATLEGRVPAIDLNYDLVMEIPCLPQIPMLLLFNDAEDGFPASCSVLFRGDVETYLDAECIAMTGYRLAAKIKKVLS
ncbi:MAG TPA: hypothetical protein DHV36_02680 [Desulfobacteraceae bacterium]|nr:hypothetical protein [Desulfobacteraceae bacterium]